MTRTEIIQHLIDRYDLKSYLEIGTQKKANNFDKIRCKYKLSIDPDQNSDADIKKTSDEFFDDWKYFSPAFSSKKFDIVFVDGLHEKQQVLRDIDNSLKYLSEDGFIIVHDCNPTSELVQRVPRESKQWVGTVWKAIVKLRLRGDLQIHTVDTDWGCAVISRAENPYPNSLDVDDAALTYDNLVKWREHWLNLISVDTFKFMHRNAYSQEY